MIYVHDLRVYCYIIILLVISIANALIDTFISQIVKFTC